MSIPDQDNVKKDVTLTSEPRYSFEISRKLLEVMSLFQSGDETRFVLCNTSFEIKQVGARTELLLASTDGRRMAIHTSEITTDNLLTSLPSSEQFAIDLCGVKKLPKSKAVKSLTVVVFEKHAEVICDKYKYKAKFLDGKFPEWRGIIPTDEPAPIVAFPLQQKLLEDFGKAAGVFQKDSTSLVLVPRVNDDGDCRVIEIRFPEYRAFYGLLMPIRRDKEKEDADGQTDWVKSLAKTEPKDGSAKQ